MNNGRLTFVVPTYRLREVGETIAQYDEHFFRNGHGVDLIVFDDSSPPLQQKYFHSLEQTPTYNDLYYVGPRETRPSSPISTGGCATASSSR